MQYIYPFFISFIFIFFSELGDKTQLLVISFSAKNKATHILLGVALGTFLSHGLAIAFGSKIGSISGENFIIYLKLVTYITFLIFGTVGFAKLKFSQKDVEKKSIAKSTLLKCIYSLTQNAIFLVATTIAIGELGDKTFLASIGLGLQYPMYKFSLICGSICGMVSSDSIAIFLGKWLGTRISDNTIEILSNTIFILFGIIGIITIFPAL